MNVMEQAMHRIEIQEILAKSVLSLCQRAKMKVKVDCE